ncbi:MAG TPA: AraC family transcriptional regulator [Burkholderiaceae bacterium]
MGRPLNLLTHYANRLGRALSYIEQNLNEPLELATLARQAAFSPYHFHRVFCEWQGETPQAYIRRQRLERSAAMLHYGRHDNQEEIARNCGFGSGQAFNRAFRNYFGMTPADWRIGGYNEWGALSTPSPTIQQHLTAQQVQIKRLPPVQTIYLRKLGAYRQDHEKFWQDFARHTDAIGLNQKLCFGVGLDDPAVTPTTRCRYDLCMELPSGFDVPRGMPVKSIGGGRYAILPYFGEAGETEDHWLWLLQIWLPQSQYKIGQQACFERYLEGIPTRGKIHSELCLSLAR